MTRKQKNKKYFKETRGITLIALVVTIIVLLILAGISISMLAGNNGILTRSTDAKRITERKSIVEQARTDILGYQVENKDYNLDRKQLKAVLDTYFKDVPDLTDMEEKEILDRKLETLDKYGIYTIAVSEIYNGNIKNDNTQELISFYINSTKMEVEPGTTWYQLLLTRNAEIPIEEPLTEIKKPSDSRGILCEKEYVRIASELRNKLWLDYWSDCGIC